MAITYGSAAGTIITSYLVTETLGSQTQQTGNNTIVLSDNPSAVASGYGGNVGNGTNGTGDSYVGRMIRVDRTGTVQDRRVISETAGTGNTFILTVHEDWDTNPIATTHVVDVMYELADIEDGGASGGIALSARTGLWELGRILVVGNGTDPAGLAIYDGQGLELADRGTADSFDVKDSGFFSSGYLSGGVPVNGGLIIAYNNTAGERVAIWGSSTAEVALYDTVFWSQLVSMDIYVNGTPNVTFQGCKVLFFTYQALYGNISLIDTSIQGRGTVNDYIVIRSDANMRNVILSELQYIKLNISAVTLYDVVFVNVPDYVDIGISQDVIFIDPIWDATTYTDFTWTSSIGNSISDNRSINTTVQESDGTKLVGARVFVYETTQTDNLEVKLTTDSNGEVSGSWIYKKHETNSITTTYGGHAIRIFNYTHTPFIASQVTTTKFSGATTLIPDSAISESTQATAITNGSGILPVRHGTGETDTRPMKVMNYDAGTGSVPTVGETITQGSATGVVVEYIGDAVSGTLVMDTWNGTEFTDNNTATGGTSSFSATTDITGGTSFYQEYTWELDANSKTLQINYDYCAAKMAEATLSVIFEQVHEWGQAEQSQLFYSGSSGYFSERNVVNTEGVWISNRGAGTVAYLTSDAGTQYIPPASYSYEITNIKTGSEVRIYSGTTELGGTENSLGSVKKASISGGGTGYTVSDTLTVTGGTGTAATLTVTSVSTGVITGISVAGGGSYSVDPTNPTNVTGGTGSGATFNLTISGEFSYGYTYVGDVDAYAVIFHLEWREVRLVDQTLSNTNQSIPVQQGIDRVYSNP